MNQTLKPEVLNSEDVVYFSITTNDLSSAEQYLASNFMRDFYKVISLSERKVFLERDIEEYLITLELSEENLNNLMEFVEEFTSLKRVIKFIDNNSLVDILIFTPEGVNTILELKSKITEIEQKVLSVILFLHKCMEEIRVYKHSQEETEC